jgi:phospholipase/carboxylesterase
VPADRIVLAGFSQGGVIALHVGLRHAERLAGIVALSTYLPELSGRAADLSATNAGLPIFMAHGTDDPMIPLAGGERARDRLTGLGYPVEFHTYPMEHSVAPEEIADLGAWLGARLTSAAG